MQQKRTLTAWMIAMINLAAICNIKNFPLMAEYGLATLFFLLLSSVFFFIPISLVSAELATGWPERGVYTWVKEGLGLRLGFVAVWLQWIENVIWYPTILSFIAATFAYVFMPELAQNKLYVVCVVLAAFWSTTFINFLGMRTSGWISSISALFGTVFPVGLIILLGFAWILSGQPVQIEFSMESLIPNFSSIRELALLSGFLMSLSGMEMSAVHAKDVKNPKKDYPRAILLSAILIIVLSALGSILIAAVVPFDQIELTSGGMEAFAYLCNAFNMNWAVPVIAGIMTFGALGMLSTWVVGPSRSLYASALDGDLPRFMRKTNKHSMPVAIMIVQGVVVSLLSLVFLTMPTVGSSYWILLALASSLYMVMYLLLFIAAIRLRHKQPDISRPYRVPGGICGMWITAGLGILGSAFSIFISFFPPSQLETGSLALYETILIGGLVVFCGLPFLIYEFKKRSGLVL